MKPLSKRIGFLTVVQEREANRHRDEQRRLAEEEEYRILKQRHRRVDEQSHQGDRPASERYQPPAPRQLWQQEKVLRYRQRVKDEQKEFGRKVVEHYQSMTERERRKAPPSPSRITLSSQCSDAAADSVPQSLGLTGTVLYIRDHCAFLINSMVVCHANRISPQSLENDGGH